MLLDCVHWSHWRMRHPVQTSCTLPHAWTCSTQVCCSVRPQFWAPSMCPIPCGRAASMFSLRVQPLRFFGTCERLAPLASPLHWICALDRTRARCQHLLLRGLCLPTVAPRKRPPFEVQANAAQAILPSLAEKRPPHSSDLCLSQRRPPPRAQRRRGMSLCGLARCWSASHVAFPLRTHGAETCVRC